jgi:hypothetical protein
MTNTVPDSQLEFNLGEGEQETLVDVPELETPENSAEAPAKNPEPAPEPVQQAKHSDELDAVSENVQRRISKLTAKMREAERREQAALEYARSVHAKAQELEQKLVVTDNSRLSETKTRITTQADQLKAIIRRAREEGDIDTETEAQERLMQLSLEQQQVNSWLQYQQQHQQQQAQAPVQQPAPVQQAAPAKRPPSPKAEDWAGRNEWFGKDKAMTYAAWGIHSTMVEEEGFDPESDEYYTELDNRIKQEFPHRFAPAQQTQQRQRQNVPAVAPATRSSGVSSARRSVKLTPSQVAIAKKLGVPLEEYAKYVKE